MPLGLDSEQRRSHEDIDFSGLERWQDERTRDQKKVQSCCHAVSYHMRSQALELRP